MLPTLACLAGLALCPPAQDEGLAAIDAASIRAKMQFLASDELRGRDTGSREALIAARFVAHALAASGWTPAGDPLDDGAPGWLQDIDVWGRTLDRAPRFALEGEADEFVYGADWELADARPTRGALRLVHVQDDADVPEVASLDVALLLDGPATRRRAWLEPTGVGAWGAVVERGRTSRREPSTDLRLRLGVRGEGALVRVHGDALDAVREAARAGRALELDIGPVTAVPSANVVGVLPGVGTAERPELADEVIVLTAHLDHIGWRTAPAGEEAEGVDRIYNGADDDASGVATVLEIAEALGAGPPPARTVVCLLVTGEEKGLLGTRYYIENPWAPLERTVCNLNFEMLGRPDEVAGGPGKLWLTGDERSTLGDGFRSSGIDVIADPRPEENFFQRSDNYAFARLGIVAQTLSSYGMHDDYHQTSDEWETLDFEHMAIAARAGLDATRLLTSGALDPEWLPGGDPSRDD